MLPITNQPRPAIPQGLGSEAPEETEETIGKACAMRGGLECATNMTRGAGIGGLSGILALGCCGWWHGMVVNTLTGMIVGASFSHKTTRILYKSLLERPAFALLDSCPREEDPSVPTCPRLNTASSQADEVPVHYV